MVAILKGSSGNALQFVMVGSLMATKNCVAIVKASFGFVCARSIVPSSCLHGLVERNTSTPEQYAGAHCEILLVRALGRAMMTHPLQLTSFLRPLVSGDGFDGSLARGWTLLPVPTGRGPKIGTSLCDTSYYEYSWIVTDQPSVIRAVRSQHKHHSPLSISAAINYQRSQ